MAMISPFSQRVGGILTVRGRYRFRTNRGKLSTSWHGISGPDITHDQIETMSPLKCSSPSSPPRSFFPPMRVEALVPRQSDQCVQCPTTPSCNCAPNQQCFLTNRYVALSLTPISLSFLFRDCFTCATVNCTPDSNSAPGGVGKGVLAGGIIGSLIFIALVVCASFWYRRIISRRNGPFYGVKSDTPASAETVLNRPDPVEKLQPAVLSDLSSFDPPSQRSPFHSPLRQSM